MNDQMAEAELTTHDEWWRGAVIYQIYPRSFFDSNGDGNGDLPGIIDKLDYVASLGVDGIWLSPFFTSPMHDFGYDVADYCDVDPIFGTLDDFDRLIARAHELGLKVVIDQVYCHTAAIHDWFEESRASRDNPKADWYHWADPKPDGLPPSNWLSVFGGPAWTWDGRRKQYYLHNFLSSQPTLNLHNHDLVEAIIDVARFWIDRGVDGFRLDALNCGMADLEMRDNPHREMDGIPDRPFDMQRQLYNISQPGMIEVIERMRAAFDEAGGIFTVAEIGGEDPHTTMTTYTSGHNRLDTAYSFDFIGTREASPDHIRAILSKWPNALDQGYPSWAFSNHDTARVASRWDLGIPQDQAAKLFALMQVALRGVLFIYQGEELGLPQADVSFEKLQDPEAIANWPQTQGRDGARTPMPWSKDGPHAGFSSTEPWLPVDPRHYGQSVQVQESEAGSVLNFFRRAIALRKSSTALQRGEFEFLDAPQQVLLWRREHEGEAVLCAFNLGGEACEINLPDGRWTLALAANMAGDTGGEAPTHLPPHSGYLARSA